MAGFYRQGEESGSRCARMPTHAVRLHEWGTQGLVDLRGGRQPMTQKQRFGLFDGDGFGQVSGLVYVAASADGDVVGKELEGDYFEDG